MRNVINLYWFDRLTMFWCFHWFSCFYLYPRRVCVKWRCLSTHSTWSYQRNKIFPVLTEAQRHEGVWIKEGKAPRILDFGNKLWIAVSYTPGPFGPPPPFLQWMVACYPLERYRVFTEPVWTMWQRKPLDPVQSLQPVSLRYILVLYFPRLRLAVCVTPSA